MRESVNGRDGSAGGLCPVSRRGSVTIASGASEAPIDKMFGAPDESRLYGSWQLAEGALGGLLPPH